MSETGFLAQKKRSPTGFTLVVAAHVAGLTALALAPPPIFERPKGPIVVESIPIPPDPPLDPPPPQPQADQRSVPTAIPTPIPIPDDNRLAIDEQPLPSVPPTIDLGGVRFAEVAPPPVPPQPIRRAAQLISRDLQPPYPAAEIRRGRGGRVQIRVTIGVDGRVTAVEQLSATSDAFWLATREQALNRWRFRPATEDGRPIVASRVMTVTFRIEDAEI